MTDTNWKLFALASALFASLTALFGKVGVSTINSNLATLIRTVVILILLAAIVTYRKNWQWPDELPSKSIVFLVLSGIATGLSWLCYYKALQMAPASRIAPFEKISVAFTIILAAVFLNETLTWKTILGGGLVVIGSLIIAL